MCCCGLWFFCAYPSFLVNGAIGHTRRRSSELHGVKSGSSGSRCRAVVPGVLACVHMYMLYVCVYICVYMYVYRHVYMYMYACVYVYVYVCMYIHVYMYVYEYLCKDCESQQWCFGVLSGVMDAHVCSCAYVCVCICV